MRASAIYRVPMSLYELLLLCCFLLCLLALLHTYIFYPLLVGYLARRATAVYPVYTPTAPDLPTVSVLMSLYNEETVIATKLASLFAQTYPAEKLSIWIGSDASTDRTNTIVQQLTAQREEVHFFPFQERRGKPGVINELARLATQQRPVSPQHIFLITDANVVLTPDVLYFLIRHFRDPRLAIVDAHMVHTGMQETGISQSEDRYINREVQLKANESLAWRKMIGPFGGCYALRTDYFHPIPDTFLVDDFYITLQVFARGGDTINELAAICHEAVSHEIGEEYRRKKRISAGNFQNLLAFPRLWWPPVGLPNFPYFSHKVLRWLGPFFLAGLLLSTGLLAWAGNLFFACLFFGGLAALLLIYGMDLLFARWHIHWLPLRHLRYFITMNLALLHGFIQYFNGIKSNVWQPPKRH